MHAQIAHSSSESSTGDLPANYGGSRGGTGDIVITSLQVLDDAGRVTSATEYGRSFILRHHVLVKNWLQNLVFRVQIDAEINKAISILDSYEAHAQLYSLEPGDHVIDIEVVRPNLRPGVYSSCPSVVQKEVGIHLFFQYNMASLAITHAGDRFFYADFRASAHLDSRFTVE